MPEFYFSVRTPDAFGLPPAVIIIRLHIPANSPASPLLLLRLCYFRRSSFSHASLSKIASDPLRFSRQPNLFPPAMCVVTCLSLKLLSCYFQPGLCQDWVLHPALWTHWLWHTPLTEGSKRLPITHVASCYTVGLCWVVLPSRFKKTPLRKFSGGNEKVFGLN